MLKTRKTQRIRKEATKFSSVQFSSLLSTLKIATTQKVVGEQQRMRKKCLFSQNKKARKHEHGIWSRNAVIHVIDAMSHTYA